MSSNKGISNVSLSTFLKDSAREQLVNTLKSIKGKKDLVMENNLTPVLDLIAGISHLKSADVEKIYNLEPGPSPGLTQRCVYLVRPSFASSRLISEQITVDRQTGKVLRQYHVIYVPSRVFEYERPFEQDGTYEYINILDLPLGLVVLDTDLFSLEIPDFFPTYFLDGDFTWILAVSRALLQLQGICGVIPNMTGQGRCAKMVLDMMERLKPHYRSPDGDPTISHLVLVDRDVDYTSLLLTQVNYSGLLDELFGFERGKVTLNPEVTEKPKPIKHPLNSSDELFFEIRDKHFTSAFSILKYRVEQMKSKLNERKGMDLSRMKKFVTDELTKVQQDHLSLTLLLSASQAMNPKLDEFHDLLSTENALIEGVDIRECTNYIEDCINQQYPIYSVLRLLCLLSITQDGLASREYKSLATLFLQSYGHEHIGTLHSLKKLGLLAEQQTSSISNPSLADKMVSVIRKNTFRTVVKKLNLIPKKDDYDFRLPPDSGYVFHGSYIPLVCQFVDQMLSREGLQKVEDTLRLLPGTTVQRKTTPKSSGKVSQFPSDQTSAKTILVFFLGGVTHAEVSALRFLGTRRGYTVLVGGTSVVNGSNILRLLSTGPE